MIVIILTGGNGYTGEHIKRGFVKVLSFYPILQSQIQTPEKLGAVRFTFSVSDCVRFLGSL